MPDPDETLSRMLPRRRTQGRCRPTHKYVPLNPIQAIVSSNMTRKDFVASQVVRGNPRVGGVHRLEMKAGSGNCGSDS